jgi:hypothetical protein
MSRALCGFVGIGLLLVASLGASPALAQATAVKPPLGGGGAGGTVGSSLGGGSSATNPTSGIGGATLLPTPLGSTKAPDLQVIKPAEVHAAPSADSGSDDCQCYRTERTPVLSSDGAPIGYSDRTVPAGRSPACCPR